MISNKTAAILFLIILNMHLFVSGSSSGTQGPSSSGKSTPLVRKRRPVLKPEEVLADTNNSMNPVRVQRGGINGMEILQGRASDTRKVAPVVKDATNTANDVLFRSNQVMTRVSVCQRLFSWTAASIAKKVKLLIEGGKYWAATCLAITINREDFLDLTCSIVKTLEQYSGIVSYLRRHNLVASFYVYGNIEVVRGTIVESRIYDDDNDYVKDGDLETALLLALEEDRHDRFMELLDVRKGATAEEDEPVKQRGRVTSFGYFLYYFLRDLAPWEDGVALRRFLILRGDEFRSKYPDILDTLCETLVKYLRGHFCFQNAKQLLVDLVGRPSLLTHVVFASVYLDYGDDKTCEYFIKLGWRETIQAGLKSGYPNGGKVLWLTMQKEQLDQYPGEFPSTEEARIAVCAHFPTKQQKEEAWIKKYFTILFNQLKDLDFLPDVLWSIISEYAVLFTAAMDLTFSTE